MLQLIIHYCRLLEEAYKIANSYSVMQTRQLHLSAETIYFIYIMYWN